MEDYEPDENGKVVFRVTPYVDDHSAGWRWGRIYPPDYDLATPKNPVELLGAIARSVPSVGQVKA